MTSDSDNRDERGRVLVVGCGNPSRRDDGVGLYIVNAINRLLGRVEIDAQTSFYSMEAVGDRIATMFVQQLGPELAEAVSTSDVAVFIDAHTGAYAEALRFVRVEPAMQMGGFTHHMEPGTLLALTKAIYGKVPLSSYVVSVLGHDFEFGQELSPDTQVLADQAVSIVVGLIADWGPID